MNHIFECRWIAHQDFMLTKSLQVRWGGGRCEQVVFALWIIAAENVQGSSIKGFAAPFALDDIHFISLSWQDEVDLTALLVPPVTWRRLRKMGLQVLQHEMLSERAIVILAQRVPATGKAHKARVEGVDFRLLHQLVQATAVKRAQRVSPPA
jgi:hypothetical protein